MNEQVNLTDVLSQFARTILTDFPIQAILDHLVVRIVETLPISSAGVTLILPDQAPQLIAASDEAALRYEMLQAEIGEGPCTAAHASGVAVAIPDLHQGVGFRAFREQAAAAGLAAVFTFPLRHGSTCLGALDLYRETAGALDEATSMAAQTLADVAAAYLLNAQTRDEIRDVAERYRTAAMMDPLTGLPNRALLQQRIEHAIVRSRRSGAVLAVLFVDIDRFKRVNDLHGHQSGDELLVAIAHRLQGVVRLSDTVARTGGDEFVVLCEDLDERERAHTVAERIVVSMGTSFALTGGAVDVTASVGIAYSGPGEQVSDRLLDEADQAMYQAKRAGGGRYQLIDRGQQVRTAEWMELERDLHGASERGELRLDYQPIVTAHDGQINGVEALLRWDHPGQGLVAPNVTIPIAEHSGLIQHIGRWVLERACADRHRLQRVVPDRELLLCVNVSPHQLMAPDFVSSVAEVLAATATPPRLVTLEVTESVYIDSAEQALIVLTELKQIGVTIALDDFGTGYSSLVYLQHFPIDIVKIDRAFVATMTDHRTSTAIIRAVVELAHVLGIGIVAEGVENEDQYERLVDLQCDSCQGFLFARPAGVDTLIHQLAAPPWALAGSHAAR